MSKADELRALRERQFLGDQRQRVEVPVTKPSPSVTKPVTKPLDVTKPTLADKPLGGRPPIGERAMTDAERQRRHRAKK